MDNQGSSRFGGELDLRRESPPLGIARGLGVVVIEAALTNGNRPIDQRLADPLEVARAVEGSCIMRVHASCKIRESRIPLGEVRRAIRRRERFTDAYDGARPAESRALYDGVPIVIERGVGKVRVAVDEGRHAPAVRVGSANACGVSIPGLALPLGGERADRAF
jgi:hypothetical protein